MGEGVARMVSWKEERKKEKRAELIAPKERNGKEWNGTLRAASLLFLSFSISRRGFLRTIQILFEC